HRWCVLPKSSIRRKHLLSSASAMVFLEAKGNPVTQISEALHLHKADGDIHDGLKKTPTLPRHKAEVKYYGARLESVNFESNAEAARANINWVDKKTEGKLQDRLQKEAVNNQNLLVNAIYCNKPVKIMYQESMFCLTLIPEVNYRGQTGLEKLERELTYDTFVAWTRWDISISQVRHPTTTWRCRIMLNILRTFKADHPFLFFIRHNNTQNILFCGRYCSP
uniref:Serpin domain-containing protein n=1 Tax=Oncorhynchus tshawytscha TaxID=74940 RepID=A0A8C8C0M9_ONCTS